MYQFAPGSTSKSVLMQFRDSTTAQGKTGLAFNSAGARASYTRAGGGAVSITLATLASAAAVWSSGGLVRVDDAKCPGQCRIDVPDAALAAGVGYVVVAVGFSATFDESVMIRLTNDAASAGGAGAIEFTVTINDDMSNPLDGAEVWVSTDVGGSNVIAGTLNTDASGQATFLLDAGNYFLWVSHSGYNRDNPSAFTVS